MMAAPAAALYGVVCRLLWLSSLALGDRNAITVEFSTPRASAPHGIGICFTDPAFTQLAAAVAVESITEGGSIFDDGGKSVYDRTSGGLNSTFFYLDSPFTPVVVETSSAEALLASDGTNSRYDDDLLVQQRGAAGEDRVLPPPPALDAGAAAVSTAAPRAWTRQAAGRCLIVSGRWQASTRYVLTLNITNPTSPPSTALPVLWLAPLTYKQLGPAAVQLLLRASKQGTMCSLRPKAAAALPRMFSPCAEAQQHGLLANGSSSGSSPPTTQQCLAALKAAATSDPAAWGPVFPFNTPPLADPSALSMGLRPDAACPTGPYALSGHLGGECIQCGNGTANAAGTSCQCYPGFTAHLAGAVACGPPISDAWNVSSAAALAARLCTSYSSYFDLMMQGQLADRLVHGTYLAAFAQQAAHLLDPAGIAEGREVFGQRFVADERLPASPTRRGRGIGPDCRSCRHGRFKDVYSQEMVAVQDDRFQAVATFRLMGYLLAAAGQAPCTALWDPDDPMKWLYGRYDKGMCWA